MWLPLALFTLGAVVVAVHQFQYWRKYGQGAEKWVFLGCMITAWAIGILFIAGMKFPTPIRPLFPAWK
ncbi:hypothetical protein DFP97_10486 [Paenibacillus prosopidis]|uniref:Uncharacterized protein n=2 Tax=Paenibacillus prosopidis TaxID=630520 RepID=A0A368W2P5_9BACL|nr:hypothetical protein DFP97_10486 [Paenibacillus prosopidis]